MPETTVTDGILSVQNTCILIRHFFGGTVTITPILLMKDVRLREEIGVTATVRK